jgi:outer membrane scaffolding protein for murein synthesis (MipA/OmpV family)
VIDLTSPRFGRFVALAAGAALFAAVPAAAQENDDQPYRTRVTVGPQVYPSYPGSDEVDFGPFIDVSRARGDEPFEFEAPDQSFGFSLIDVGPFSIGPVASLEGSRKAEDVGVPLPKVKLTVEVGGAVELGLGEHFRLYSEVRKGLGGHKGWIANGGADVVFRDGDAYLFSIGPRVTWSDDQYHDAWFGIEPEDAGPSGLPAYDPGGGIQAYGVTASFLTQLSDRWGISTYAKYDRLVGDAADSPLVREYGSRDQLSGGLALSYTFGRAVN